jgi:hypothetical protein
MPINDKPKHELYTSVGQLVERLVIVVEGVPVTVAPLDYVAIVRQLTPRRLRQQIATGEIIGIKISGCWFTPLSKIKTLPQTERH